MTVGMVLLPVFVQVGLTFALLFAMATARTRAVQSGETRLKDIALRQPNWPERPTQIANCFSNQFELPVLFYVLIALALPLRHADLAIVLLSWVFVADAVHSCRHLRHVQRRAAAVAGLVRRCHRAADHVDLVRDRRAGRRVSCGGTPSRPIDRMT